MTISKKIKKNSSGLINPFLYAIVPLLVLITLPGGDTIRGAFVNGATLTFLKDMIGFPLNVALVFLIGKKQGIWKEIRSKSGIFAMIAGLFGGPIGYSLFNTSFYLAGPSFGHVFTSVEPVLLVIMVFLLYKRKFNYIILTGVVLSTLSVMALVFGSSLSSGDNAGLVVLGSILGILGAASWAVESIFFEKAIKHSKSKDVNFLITLKVGFALFINITFFLPILSSINDNPTDSYEKIGSVLVNSEWLWRIILGGIILFVARLLYFSAVKNIGPTIASVLYLLSVMITPILSMIVYGVTREFIGHDDSLLDTRFQITFWVCSTFIVISSALVIIGQRNKG